MSTDTTATMPARAPSATSVGARWALAGIGGGSVALALAAIVHQRHCAIDDAYITFRYADNLVDGLGLRWNPDSAPCEGYTNLLHLLGVAGLHRLGMEHAAAALLISLAAVLGLAVLLARQVPWRSAWAPAVLAPGIVLFANHDLQVHASRGLETVLFATMAIGFVVATQRLVARPGGLLRGVATGGAGFLLLLTRPDGGLVVAFGLSAAFLALRRRGLSCRGPVAAGAAFAAALGAYAAWKLSYFGYLLPNPFYLKATAPGWNGVQPMLDYLAAYRWELGVAALLLVAAGLLARAPVRSHAAGADAGPGSFVPMLVLALASAWFVYGLRIVHEGGYDHRFSWHLVPLIAYAATVATADIGRRLPAQRWIGIGAWLALACASVAIAPQVASTVRLLGEPPPRLPMMEQFRRFGEIVRDAGHGWSLKLLCTNAGVTPFVARAHHMDPVGLTDDGFCLRTPEEQRAAYLQNLRPDVVAWYLFPASPGATSFADDERAGRSTYVQEWCLGSERIDEAAKLVFNRGSVDDRMHRVFFQMALLRDLGTFVGEMTCGVRGWRYFIYVWRSSPRHDELVAYLASRVDVPARDVDFLGWGSK